MYTQYSRFEAKMGYDYPEGEVQVLDWMKQNFKEKMVKYLGGHPHVSKRSRMDKIEMKERLGFSLKVNPLVSTFTKLNNKITTFLLSSAFSHLCS